MTGLTIHKSRDYAAAIVWGRNMAPEIRHGDVVFLGEHGFSGEGVYQFNHPTCGGLHRVINHPTQTRRWIMKLNGFPEEGPFTAEEVAGLRPRRVEGLVTAYTGNFSDFLWERFREVIR